MILLVFEGGKSEPRVMATLRELFFPEDREFVLCSFGTDTYTLWKEVVAHSTDGFEADTFSILKQYLQKKGDNTLDGYYSYQVEAIYLFFDYDPQSSMPAEKLNGAVSQMCRDFSDAMGKGKIYISYPMFEALFCVNSIPEDSFIHSVVPLSTCHGFKEWCYNNFYYDSHPLELLFKTSSLNEVIEVITDPRRKELITRWHDLVGMNVRKANLICNGSGDMPKDERAIPQERIFQHELDDFMAPSSSIAIISSFPIFLFDYFGIGS